MTITADHDSSDLQNILSDILDIAIEIAGADFGNIQLCDRQTRDLTIVAHKGFPQSWVDFWNEAGRGQGVCGQALGVATRVIVDDVSRSPIFPQGSRALEMQLSVGVRAVQSTPLFSRSGTPIGMFSTHYRTAGRPSDRTLRILDLLARLAADAIEQVQISLDRDGERKRREAAEEANRAKDLFLATLSHELRTPLTAVLSWAQLLRRAGPGSGDSKLCRGLEIIEMAARAQGQLINDLLDFSRIMAGKLVLDLKDIDPVEAIREAAEAVKPEAEKKGQVFELSLPSLDGTILCDPARMKQIMWNLLSNSVKFTPDGGRIQVALARQGAHAVIRVSDSGRGFSPCQAKRIFERFAQGDASTTRVFGGLGLGLSLVRSLTEMQGGQVTAYSEGEGKGATFTLEFPVREAHVYRPGGQPRQIETPSLEGVRLVLVDDEKTTGEAIAGLLGELGAEVAVAESAEQALATVHKDPPDVLISDIAMPGEDGYSLIRRLRSSDSERVRNLPAIAMTAFAGGECRARAMEAGFSGYAPKPVEVASLASEIRRFCS